MSRDLVLDAGEPDSAHVRRSRSVLELAFFSHLAIGIDDEPGSAAQAGRRSDGEAILGFFNGDWRSWPHVHHCRGCCSSREAAVKKGVKTYMLLLRRRVPIPALNRWLQVFPVVTLF